MTHQCPAPGCQRDDIPDDYLMCSQDWYRVPKPLRNAVWSAWKGGQGRGSARLTAAQAAAIRSLRKEAQ